MKLILLTDIPKLGKSGDIVEAKDGYARNFLIPQKIALPATPQSIKLTRQKKEREIEKEKAEKEKIGKLAEKISKISCTISAHAGDEDKLFGEITNKNIAKSLADKGIEIDRKRIKVKEPIRKLGVYDVEIKLHPDIAANLRLCVVKDESSKKK
ncbi:MAG: 50S ribosomal protein L9 [Candidatus Omnitrophica bacterium]|nr:50S ribosomal protein L9 [Candidatus Omnitrophota bacterium]